MLRPEPASIDAVHVQRGVLSAVGVVVDKVAGIEGAVVSTLKAMLPELAVELELAALNISMALARQ